MFRMIFCRNFHALHLSHLLPLYHDVGFSRIDHDALDAVVLSQQQVAVLLKCDNGSLGIRIVLPLQELQPVRECRKQLGAGLVGNGEQGGFHLTISVFVGGHFVQIGAKRDRCDEGSVFQCLQHCSLGLLVLILFKICHCGNQLRVFDFGFLQLCQFGSPHPKIIARNVAASVGLAAQVFTGIL